jgi:glycosyltransferase involved in cell wall biosynthesis
MSGGKSRVKTPGAQSRQRSARTRATSPAAQVSTDASAKSDRRLRVLVTSHSHPKLTKGGAEISAYALFQGLQTQADTAGWFLGCSNKRTETRAGSCISQPFGDSEYIYDPTVEFDYFKFANSDPQFPEALDGLITSLAPDIVHAHHYAIFGVEMFRRIKKLLPHVRIFLTLHEYLAICHNHGQMVKAETYRLCRHESLIDCHACFPSIRVQDFFLRKEYFLRFLSWVDKFVAPSRFLASRYVEWGISGSKIIVMENVMSRQQGLTTAAPAAVALPPAAKLQKKPRLRVGFFGQMSPLKGIKVLLDAARLLHERRARNIYFDIFGDYVNQPSEFQEAVIEALKNKDPASNIFYHGPYDNEDVNSLMQTVDIVVVPSIWWENSPVVIREALYNQRPVICSNIGGMAEKVRPGLDGLHFAVGDAPSLAALLEDLLASPDGLETLRMSVQAPVTPDDGLQQHIQAYRQALSADQMQ